MRSRISATTRRKLDRLEQSLAVGRPIALWPKMLSCDEWERIAQESQDKLLVDSNDTNETAVTTKKQIYLASPSSQFTK